MSAHRDDPVPLPPHDAATAVGSRCLSLAEGLGPYLACSPGGYAASRADAPRAGLAAAALRRVDAHRLRSAGFIERVHRLRELICKARGLAAPRWALYDCALVPGAAFGLSGPASGLNPAARHRLGIERGPTGDAPHSMVIAVPMLDEGTWHLHGLGSVHDADGDAPAIDLLLATLALGSILLDVRAAYVAIPWRSPMLPVYARLAPLEVLAAWTPAHSEPATVTFRFATSAARLLEALKAEPVVDRERATWIDPSNHAALWSLEEELAAGRRLEIAGPPRRAGTAAEIPLREVAP